METTTRRLVGSPIGWGILLSVLACPSLAWEINAADAGPPEIRTQRDMKRIGEAMFEWLLDGSPGLPMAPVSTSLIPRGIGFDAAAAPVLTAAELESYLVPDYLRFLPADDGWGNAYEYRFHPDRLARPRIVIRSAGSDGAFSGTVYTPGFTSGAVAEDLVWSDRMFIRRHPPLAAEAVGYTVEQLQLISSALASWRTDQVGRLGPKAAASRKIALTGCEGYVVDLTGVPATTADAIEAMLAPGYLPFLPRLDGWQRPLEFRFDSDLLANSGFQAIRSAGADGTYESSSYEAGLTASNVEDLVTVDFFLIRRPPPTGKEQEETLNDLRVIGNTTFSWVTDHFRRPVETPTGVAGPFDTGDLVPITHGELEALLVPFYLLCLPRRDAWDNEYDFWLDVNNLFSIPLVGIRSRGSDGIAEGPVYDQGSFPAVDTEQDLLWVDGFVIRFPDFDPLFHDGFESGNLVGWPSSVSRGTSLGGPSLQRGNLNGQGGAEP